MFNSINNIIRNIYDKEMFIPSVIGIFINPFYIIRRELFKSVIVNKKYLRGKMLDFGCGKKLYKKYLDVDEYIGLDIKDSGHNHKN